MSSLPLIVKTPDSWANSALSDPIALLDDHGHLEKKAASNAMSLIQRWPEDYPSTSPNFSAHAPEAPMQRWTKELTAIARDEALHLAQVVKILNRRGAHLSKSHINRYAQGLRDLERRGNWRDELIDRLLVSALIEARSCERFELLARHCEDEELRKLYGGLYASEHGHYRVFLELATEVNNQVDITQRWQEMLEGESEVIQRMEPGPRIHSWV